MGITESSNRATSEAAQYIYAQNVLMPRLRRREEAINKQLLPMFGPDLVWRYEDIVPRNQEFDKAVALDGWNAGLLTKDEAREKLGMPPAPVGGDVYKTTFSDVFVHEDDDPAALSVAAANLQYADGAPPLQESGSEDIEITQGGDPILSSGVEGEGNTAVEITDGKKRPTPEEKKASLVQAAQRALLQAEREESRRFEIATAKFFREQSNRITSTMGGTEKAERTVWDILLDGVPEYDVDPSGAWMKLDEAERAQRVDNFVLGLIDWPGEAAVLASIFDPLWKESYAKGAEVASRVYGLPGYSEAGVGVYRQAEGRHQGEEYHGNHPEGNRPYCLLWPGARGQQGHDCLPNPGGDADHQRTGPDHCLPGVQLQPYLWKSRHDAKSRGEVENLARPRDVRSPRQPQEAEREARPHRR